MNLQEHFQALDRVLHQWQSLWRDAPFMHPRLAWEQAFPGLSQALRALTDQDLRVLQDDPQMLLDWVCRYEPRLQVLGALSILPELPLRVLPPVSPQLSVDVPGRKWQQIAAFIAALPALDAPVVDWCAGKGHLGRMLSAVSHGSVTVDCVEWQSALCECGQRLSERARLPVRHHVCDVLQDDVAPWLAKETHVVALHACGGLQRRLLQQVLLQQCRAVSFSPCCYHLEPQCDYQPFSAAGRDALLKLDRDALRLCVQETVTAGARERRLRDRAKAWRLGFDQLQRDCRGEDAYLNTPPVPAHWLRGNFAAFCGYLADVKAIPLPSRIDWQRYEHTGWQRCTEVARLELLRHVFRRPLELWLVLDRALALQASGYAVKVGTFCSRQLTPRNCLIQAWRGAPAAIVADCESP